MSSATNKTFQPKIVVDNTHLDSDDYRPLIPGGVYQLKLQAHSTELHFGKKPRLILKFSVVDMGEHHGTTLYRFYNIESLLSKAGINGRFKPPKHGDFLIEYFNIAKDCGRPRLDRISLEPLYKKIIVGRVRTVDKNSQQKSLPDQLKYSVVAELLRVEE